MSRDALIVGISSYQNLPGLKAPAVDAEAIAQQLEQAGEFRVWRIPEIIQDKAPRIGERTQVSLSELKQALVRLFKPEGRQVPDIALFYFSGHGLRDNLGVPEGYLATSDADPKQDDFGLSLCWLRRLLEESPVRQQVIWLDCCHSGELLNFGEADPGDRGKGRDRCFIAASREFEPAYEALDSAHSA
ncbi:MAG: caspase family protein [Leptolyngbyaceae cyanobacterium MO_188.B28]|nr:caspase family protein [Leptolyngbyaceae cyanobacterium MO_188.B28]